MPENAPQQPEMYTEPKRGTWHGPEFDVPAVVVGTYGQHQDGREYLMEQGGVGIPADEFEESRDAPPPDPNAALKWLITLAIKRVLR